MKSETLQRILGENITKYRTEQGMTQAYLAEMVGVSTAFLSRVERGQKMMKVPTLLATADALHVSCDALLRENAPSANIETITKQLTELPDKYILVIERLVRVAIKEFCL